MSRAHYATDKIALITGGATGIGRATALALAESGARGITVNYSKSAAEARSLLEELNQAGSQAIAVRADISTPDGAESLIRTTLATFGRLDILVNSAARTRAIPFPSLSAVTDDDWREILGLNIIGAFNCAKAASEHLRDSHGSIVNIASASAERATGTSIPYSVSKAALVHLTRCLAIALAPDVQVNTVSPGAVETRWVVDVLGEEAAQIQHERERAKSPLGTIAKPRDIAAGVLAILDTRHATGQNLIIDGGRIITY